MDAFGGHLVLLAVVPRDAKKPIGMLGEDLQPARADQRVEEPEKLFEIPVRGPQEIASPARS